MKNYILYILLFFEFFAVAQKTPTVSAKVDTTNIRIGEQINYQITVDDAENGVIFPKLQLDSLGKIEIVESLNIDTLKNRLIKKYKLTSFDSGKYVIPKQPIYIWNQPYYTDSILIDVATVAVDTTKQKMYPIKAIQSEPYTFEDFKSYLWWILGILLLIALILYFVLRKKETPEEIEARIPPYQLALTRLKKLDEKQLWQKNKIKKYYVELTDIVRSYIERELSIPALESTTDELMETMTDFNASSSLNIPDETINKLQKLLQEADLVKFAKYKPLSNEIELHRNDAGYVIDEIKTTTPQDDFDTEDDSDQEDSNEIFKSEVLVKKNVVKRKWSTKRILIASVILLAILGIITIGTLIYKGVNYAKDNIIGHQTKELVEGKWFKSTYGHPAVTLETPKVLKAQKIEIPEQFKNSVKGTTVFAYGSLLSNFSISVTTTGYTDIVESFSLEASVEGALQQIRTNGATIVSKEKEVFNIGSKEAMKVAAEYVYENPLTKKVEKSILNLVVIGDIEGSMVVIVTHKKDDNHGKEIAERIINSIEIEDEVVE